MLGFFSPQLLSIESAEHQNKSLHMLPLQFRQKMLIKSLIET